MANLTYKQAAEKLGTKVSFIRQKVYTGELEIINLGHRTKLISELALERFVTRRTRREMI